MNLWVEHIINYNQILGILSFYIGNISCMSYVMKSYQTTDYNIYIMKD